MPLLSTPQPLLSSLDQNLHSSTPVLLSQVVEEFTFTASLDCLTAMGVNVLPCPIDALGLVPSALRALLETCRQFCQSYRQSGSSTTEDQETNRRSEQKTEAVIDADVTAAAIASSLFHGRYMPKALYTVPVGQNPTGSRLAPQRYQEIYAVRERVSHIGSTISPNLEANPDLNLDKDSVPCVIVALKPIG